MLNTSGKSGPFCLILNPSGKTLHLSPLSMMLSLMLAVSFSYMTLIMLR